MTISNPNEYQTMCLCYVNEIYRISNMKIVKLSFQNLQQMNGNLEVGSGVCCFALFKIN